MTVRTFSRPCLPQLRDFHQRELDQRSALDSLTQRISQLHSLAAERDLELQRWKTELDNLRQTLTEANAEIQVSRGEYRV